VEKSVYNVIRWYNDKGSRPIYRTGALNVLFWRKKCITK
jgi:hypothetical protein